MDPGGYPPLSLCVVLVVGIVLAYFWPYRAVLFALFVLGSGSSQDLNQTRFEALGPYLNLADACLLVLILGCALDTFDRRTFRVPRPVVLICAVLLSGCAHTIMRIGVTYESIRALKWALDLPLGFLIAANVVTTPDRVRRLLRTLFLVAAFAGAQHLLFVVTATSHETDALEHYGYFRTISYMAGGLPAALLLTITLWQGGRLAKRLPYQALCVVIALSLFLSQTKSAWIAFVATIPVLQIFFTIGSGMKIYAKILTVCAVYVLVAVTIFGVLMPDLELHEVAAERVDAMFDADASETTSGSRMRAWHNETQDWTEGSLLFGRGLHYYQDEITYVDPDIKEEHMVAWGHLGYVTYLSQLGIIGFILFALYLPLSVLRDAREVYAGRSTSPSARFLALLAASCMIFHSFMFLMSSSFLDVGCFLPGALCGAVWSLARIRPPSKGSQP